MHVSVSSILFRDVLMQIRILPFETSNEFITVCLLNKVKIQSLFPFLNIDNLSLTSQSWLCIFSCLETVYETTMQDRKKCNKSTQYLFHREHGLNSYHTDYSSGTPCGRKKNKMFTRLNTAKHNTEQWKWDDKTVKAYM